jgi:polyketide cyclase/dehydrase/lipid transport protein
MTIELTYGESIDIDAPIDAVYEYRLDFVKLAVYNSNVTNIRRTKEGENALGAGAEYVFDLTLPGWDPMEGFLNVVETDKPNRIVTDTGTAALAGREVNTCELTADGKVRLTIQFSMSLPDEAKDGVEWMEKSGRDQYVLELGEIKKTLEG